MAHFRALLILALPLLGVCDSSITAGSVQSAGSASNITSRASRTHTCDGGRYDIVVVGAGLAGLTAAKQLRATGHRVLVLEARGRVGGRVHGKVLKNGGTQELGAEFIGPTQDKMYALAKELGLQTYNEYDTGNTTFYVNGAITSQGASGLDQASVKQYFDANAALDAIAAEIDPKEPWSHPKAREWDRITYGDWIKKQASSSLAQSLQAVQTTSIFSAEPHEVSLLYVAAYTAAAGNATAKGTMSRLTGTTDGAQQDRIIGGSQLFATKLAENLKAKGVRIKLNSPVESIRNEGHRYIVETQEEDEYCASDVVVAMSPPLARHISFSPPLPRDRARLMAGMRMASVGKVIAIYDQPFWRNASLNGQAIADTGAARSTFDNSPADGSYGALMAFVEGDEMRRWDRSSESALQAQVLQEFGTYFGRQAVEGVREFFTARWNLEEWSRGGPVAFTLPGVLSQYGAVLRESVDGIHFAGTETSDYWVGYMEGAVRSGERVAREISHSMKRRKT